jgi:hypothetical protein
MYLLLKYLSRERFIFSFVATQCRMFRACNAGGVEILPNKMIKMDLLLKFEGYNQ